MKECYICKENNKDKLYKCNNCTLYYHDCCILSMYVYKNNSMLKCPQCLNEYNITNKINKYHLKIYNMIHFNYELIKIVIIFLNFILISILLLLCFHHDEINEIIFKIEDSTVFEKKIGLIIIYSFSYFCYIIIKLTYESFKVECSEVFILLSIIFSLLLGEIVIPLILMIFDFLFNKIYINTYNNILIYINKKYDKTINDNYKEKNIIKIDDDLNIKIDYLVEIIILPFLLMLLSFLTNIHNKYLITIIFYLLKFIYYGFKVYKYYIKILMLSTISICHKSETNL